LILYIFAIIPKTDYPKTLGGDIDRNSPFFNPLFFGHFAHIPIDEYKEDYAETLMTDDSIYNAMAGDIYGQGKVLALRKYKFLKWSYMSFLWGMIGAIVIFLLRGPIGEFIYPYLIRGLDTFINEMLWMLEGMKELVCQGSYQCRNK